MASTTYVLNLGEHYEGVTDLRAQLRDDTGAPDGSPISTGFTAIGSGVFQWTGDIANGYQGSISFYRQADATYTLLGFALNGGSESQPDASGNPETVNAFIYHYQDGEPLEGAKLYHQQIYNSGLSFDDDIHYEVTDVNGFASFEAVRGGTYKVWIDNGRFRTVSFDDETEDPYELPDLGG